MRERARYTLDFHSLFMRRYWDDLEWRPWWAPATDSPGERESTPGTRPTMEPTVP